ncbi:MAG: Transcriptional regulator, Xre family, partial [uncultured Chloroflexia bacterium]
CRWWRWAATSPARRRWSTATGWTWRGLWWASACHAGCATAWTAAAEPSRRWSTGWRWTPWWAAPRLTGSSRPRGA